MIRTSRRPQDLIVYGGGGKAARDWACDHAMVAALQRLTVAGGK